MKKTKTEALQTRQQLLEAALEVFWRNGVTRATLQQIAEEAGMTRGALYWHFKNKEDIFEALFEQHFRNFHRQFDATVLNSQTDVWTYLHHNLLDLFRLVENNEREYKFFSMMHHKCERTADNQSLLDLAERYYASSRERIEHVLTLSVAQGRLPANTDIALASLYLKSTISGLLHLWLEQPQAFSLSQAATKIIGICLHNLQEGHLFAACPDSQTHGTAAA